ncbi:MAG: nuclear transport factor 2 family protein [Acidobacteriaceae bacterium]
MRLSQAIFCACLLSAFNLSARPAISQHSAAVGAETTAITAALNQSADDWNRGDLDAFATSYKNSPDILFMGRTIQHGYAQMLARYKAAYPTHAAMGTLSFTRLEVQPLDDHFATVTGHFHLERTASGGGNADGYFLLVLEHTAGGWKIVRDDTTALPPPAAK